MHSNCITNYEFRVNVKKNLNQVETILVFRVSILPLHRNKKRENT